ncbi:MAG TPA: adenylate/guanylate cyclase domain-containing protein [Chthoniobacterales bacterium]|jgi:TolB-like protein
MPTDFNAESESEFEIAHVLCTDIVGYSKLMIDQQAERLRMLNDIVRSTEAFKRADAAGKLLRIPTGDGMILVFFTHPQDPAECAVQIATELKSYPDIPLRMGVHSGPVSRISDVNQRSNVAGAGINMAQRVMDCGDAGHILLSKRVAEDLAHFSKWRPYLQELGECEVKHGVKIDLANLYTDNVGNPAPPEKFIRAKQDQDAAALAVQAATARGAAVVRRQRVALIAGLLLAILAAAAGFWMFSQRQGGTPGRGSTTIPGIESLAVKPLENLSGDKDKDYFADGMTDELTTKLSQIGALKRVVARSTMMKYKQSPKSSADIAHEIGVQAMVEGSVVLAGDQARISVRLVDAGTVLWASSYTRNVANIVRLQNEVALAIANAVALELTPGEKTRFANAPAVNPQAYDDYLRGKNIIRVSRDTTNSSIELLEKAVSLDDKFADAYAELANAYEDKGYFFQADDKEWAAKAEKAAAKALTLSPELPSALLVRAGLLFTPAHGFPHEQVITEAQRAIAVAPSYGDAHGFLGAVYFHVGLIQEALTEIKRADELMPGNETVQFHLGMMQLFQGRYREASATMEKNINGFVRAFVEYNIAAALSYDGHGKEAAERIEAAKTQFDDEGGIMTSMQALLLATSGDKPRATEKIEEAIKIGQGFGHFHHTTYAIASAYALMNEHELAMKWLTYTAENGYPNLTWFERDPNLDNIRKNPQFIDFLQKLRPRFERLKALAAAPNNQRL